MSVFLTIVLDGVGIGAQPDADEYGDAGSNTLAHVCAEQEPHLPHLTALGLGRIAPLAGVPAAERPQAHVGRMREVSAGKDSTTGHWELAGLQLDAPFPTYPEGFPPAVIDAFTDATGCDGVLGNKAASGTVIIEELGPEHAATGQPIVYTSADSVFQIAAHKDVIPLDRLYELCRIARREVCVGPHAVGRVIARPFVGSPGNYERISSERRDFARRPEDTPLHEHLQAAGVHTVSIGKIADLFAREGFDEMLKTTSNAHGIEVITNCLHAYAADPAPTFLWANLIDFDQAYGHRNDPAGFATALEAFDAALPDIIRALPESGVLVITADHGNDPTTGSTDHSREFVPLLAYHHRIEGNGADLGLRASFNDHAATVARYFDLPADAVPGTPFLPV
ncbi:phosphopentomutase [Salisaeta longa]|uniref:phosphopentomutase n=1 Tax=Salisaeta longa TaxID=503170 RepID=UPI0003B33E99|nr:phosphopentomutase [Salisaeta longa]